MFNMLFICVVLSLISMADLREFRIALSNLRVDGHSIMYGANSYIELLFVAI